jgi:hypothetical protein
MSDFYFLNNRSWTFEDGIRIFTRRKKSLKRGRRAGSVENRNWAT